MKNKDKYSLDKLEFVFTYKAASIVGVKIFDNRNCIYCRYYDAQEFTPRWAIDFIKWLDKKYYLTILTEKEKEYLSAVIMPFRDVVLWIKKESIEGYKEEWISIGYKSKNNNGFGVATLPNFKTGTLYKDMEADKQYNLKELGL